VRALGYECVQFVASEKATHGTPASRAQRRITRDRELRRPYGK
jgi:hypothetical protein